MMKNKSGMEKIKNNKLLKNKGKMQANATVADQYITYPTDNGKEKLGHSFSQGRLSIQ